ncbi:ankyrin repeat, SAM and basic leucine zipper domain-containing protein 1 [Lingula anatina]|uniref:Ankyrin repeat, SAM and basic leucine zipper domain-containing protein 1 n=1 Tax=Lingula anatina TaxID=7574 RepID=A0A1S3GYW9_LINAN|nr:ankyrin repeat, SAM and basic leucine zipper domain-containing protein 1 [Lingula anatina]|eukprot:XP_023933463.1 ankyrin repeat, SAM and basic leucine zipper domain-containing protein 1 [Lingula anatina]
MDDLWLHWVSGDGTQLCWAAEVGDIEKLQRLLTAGQCDINVQGFAGMTPLHWAADHGHTQCVQLLLQHGADTMIQDWGGSSPLHWAAGNGRTQCVQLLLEHGADASIEDWEERTPLHLAAEHGHTQCVQLLLQHGADTSIQDCDEMTPLYYAAVRRHTQCVQLLLQHGADTSIQDRFYKRTPLHWAASGGHTQCVQLLLQHGADSSNQDKEKKTPRMLAEEKERTAVVELLRRFEIPDIQMYIQTRTLEYLAEILDPTEYLIFNLTNLDPNFPEVFLLHKIQGLKDWVAMNNYTTIKDIKVGLLAANFLRLSSAAVEYYAEMVINITNMPPDEFEALCRTLTTAKYMFTQSSTTRIPQVTSSSLNNLRYDAFIGHSGEDKGVVEPVVEQLEKQGVRCCIGRRDFHLGKSLSTSIEEAVDESTCTIVFLSTNFMKSPWCTRERELAIHKAVESRENPVIPVLIDYSPQQIPSPFKGIKCISVKHQELIPKLIEAVRGSKKSPTNGELQIALQNAQEEIEFQRDQITVLTGKLRLQ